MILPEGSNYRVNSTDKLHYMFQDRCFIRLWEMQKLIFSEVVGFPLSLISWCSCIHPLPPLLPSFLSGSRLLCGTDGAGEATGAPSHRPGGGGGGGGERGEREGGGGKGGRGRRQVRLLSAGSELARSAVRPAMQPRARQPSGAHLHLST